MVHQKKEKNPVAEGSWRITDLGSHARKHHNTGRILRRNFIVFIYSHTSVLQLYGFCSSNLSVIAAISRKHEWCTAPQNQPWLLTGTALHSSGDQQNSRLCFSPQSSAETPLLRAFQVRHTSQLCQCAQQVISIIKPFLHHISDQISHLCVLCIFSSGTPMLALARPRARLMEASGRFCRTWARWCSPALISFQYGWPRPIK